MSVGWRQNGRLLTDADGLGIVSNLCPCHAQWYIATYCPCEECGTPVCRVGEAALIESVPVLLDGDPLYFVDMVAPSPDGENPQNPCSNEYVSGVGCTLAAVTHTAKPAPFACTLTAQVWVNGVKLAEWVKTGVAENEEVELGDDETWDEDVAFASIPVDYELVEAGVLAVNLSVEYSAEGQDTVRYTCRTGVRVFEPEQESPWVGDVFVVPDWYASAGCVAETTLGARLSISTLLGPYDTEAEAQAEMEGTHAAIIAEWAAKCQCPRCEFVRDGFWQASLDSESGLEFPYTLYDVCTTAGQSCVSSPVNCWRKLTYGISQDEGVTIKLYINGEEQDLDGADVEPKIFYIPPCATVEENAVFERDSVECGVHFYCEELGQPDPCPYDKEAYPTLADYLESLEA